MNAVSHDSFDHICDQLSSVVDTVQFERMRWARDVGPRLAELVALTLAAVEPRPDLELAEERSTTEVKRYILKVHGVRVIGIALWIKDGQASMQPVEIERSKYALSADDTISGAVDGIDAAWVAEALKQAFALIERREEPEAAVETEAEVAHRVAERPRHPEPPRLKTLRVG